MSTRWLATAGFPMRTFAGDDARPLSDLGQQQFGGQLLIRLHRRDSSKFRYSAGYVLFFVSEPLGLHDRQRPADEVFGSDAGTVIPVYEQATQYEDDVQLSNMAYSMQWTLAPSTNALPEIALR